MKKHVLAFDLSYNTVLNFYIPRALIVQNEDTGLGYVTKSANTRTLSSYGIELEKHSEELKLISDKLQPHSLHKKYNANNKDPKSLDQLLNNENFKKIIDQFIQVSLEKFLHLISQARVPLSINLEKDHKFKKHQVFFSDIELEPKLYFHKMKDAIEYRLRLFDEKKELIPSGENFKILLDQPPFIVHEDNIHRLKYINANKIKPFLHKDAINIPERNSAVYFDKFIKKVIKKAPVEAKGFEVVKFDSCHSCTIKPTTTIFSNVYHLEIYFQYENHSFSILDKNQKHIKLDHDENGEFTVFETVRDQAQEQKFIDILKSFGVLFLHNQLATFNADIKNIDVYYNLSKLIDRAEDLKSESIEIDLQIDRFKINDNPSFISTQYQEKKDWFDVEMMIKTGKFQFPFTSLISNLRSGERLYELPDGSYFLIPLEWFKRFGPLIDLGKVEKDSILAQKNQFTLLEKAGIATQKDINKDIVPYQTTGKLKAKLRPYQKEGVNWLVKNYQMELGSCLADDMGLGKTIQTLAYLDFVHSRFENDLKTAQEPNFPLDLFSVLEVQDKTLKALIVSPSSLTFNWHNEAQKFCPHFSSLSYVGPKRKIKQKKIPKADLVFTSYGILLKDIEFFKNLYFNFIIIDESQQIKNRNSKIFKAINSIKAKHKVSLSGTPIENSLSDLWSQMQFINPDLLGSYSFFDEHFKKPIEKANDEEKMRSLKTLIGPYLLRRTKTEVAQDLPELSEQIYYTELSDEQAKLYEAEKSKVRNHLIDNKLDEKAAEKNKSKISILNALMKLRQLANHPKLIGEDKRSGKFEVVTAYLETLIRSKQKTLVFSSFTSHLRIYADWCDQQDIKYNLLTGKTKAQDREREVDEFDNGQESQLFFISLKAGGTGLNLTKASYVIILDPWWNPFAELQAIGRAHRIGQKQKVNVIRVISKKSIEEKINQLQQTKKDLSDNIIENQITEEIINNIDEILD